MTMRVDLFREKHGSPSGFAKGDYRWRIWESSDVIGASSEGYKDRRDMIHNLLAVTGGRLRRRRDELFLERRSVRTKSLLRVPVRDETGDRE